MKSFFSSLGRVEFTFAVALVWGVPALAQIPGYVSGRGFEIQAFNPSGGQLLNPISPSPYGDWGTTAVSKDGSTLYVPVVYGSQNNGGALQGYSASSGQMLWQILGFGLMISPGKVILSPAGTYAFVTCPVGGPGPNSIAIVNLTKQKVVGFVHVQGGDPVDIAIPPNGKQFFVSAYSYRGNGVAPQAASDPAAPSRPVYECKAPGICVFDTSTFALTGHITGLYGFLALSQDGNSLYVSGSTLSAPFYVVNTTSLAISAITLPAGTATSMSMALSPTADSAVLFAITPNQASVYYVLNTQTNVVSGAFPAPLFPSGSSPAAGSNVIAFSADGSSVWSLGCDQNSNCNVIAGQSFPSGDMIAQTSLGSTYNGFAITF